MKRISEEVYFVDKKSSKVDSEIVVFLKEKARENQRRKIRLCTHVNTEESLHEMLIVHGNSTYVTPHKHLKKSESYHIIEGTANLIFFDEDGEINTIVQMGDYSSGKTFYYRISDSRYHTMVITSEFLTYHETTNGPFDRSQTVFAPWAPAESDAEGVRLFTKNLHNKIGASEQSDE